MIKKIRIWGLLTNSYYMDLGKYPPHQVQVEVSLIRLKRILKIVKKHDQETKKTKK